VINKPALIGITAIMAVGFASPAFAEPDAATPYDSGVSAFGMVDGSNFTPPANGGGSFGYNENLRRDAW
jgi:hypothetical protein